MSAFRLKTLRGTNGEWRRASAELDLTEAIDFEHMGNMARKTQSNLIYIQQLLHDVLYNAPNEIRTAELLSQAYGFAVDALIANGITLVDPQPEPQPENPPF